MPGEKATPAAPVATATAKQDEKEKPKLPPLMKQPQLPVSKVKIYYYSSKYILHFKLAFSINYSR